ncbi:hypothetical protein [Lentibacillus sp. Marseille-P4043]|uniref:hypothetical protein n=1 Tax=Lentibacillus sp. Marseille-P4043 TaxID=2040293 RepID=UPI000D0B2539|nr:hypothetical protein [Lentibacillus sp. Marseille-P4043]
MKKAAANQHTSVKENPSFSSPTSAVSTEETRVLNEHINQQNMFKLIHLYEPHRKTLTLKMFFKMKRNQQVVITPVSEIEESATVEGKVAAVGRDFVMITNLQKRIWLPYRSIKSATIPFGTPTYSNPHQHHIYDNRLRKNLVLSFGETVTKRDALIQQFFEESIRTNLDSWKGTWVKVKTSHTTQFGKIKQTNKEELNLKHLKSETAIPLQKILYIETLRLINLWKEVLKSIF